MTSDSMQLMSVCPEITGIPHVLHVMRINSTSLCSNGPNSRHLMQPGITHPWPRVGDRLEEGQTRMQDYTEENMGESRLPSIIPLLLLLPPTFSPEVQSSFGCVAIVSLVLLLSYISLAFSLSFPPVAFPTY